MKWFTKLKSAIVVFGIVAIGTVMIAPPAFAVECKNNNGDGTETYFDWHCSNGDNAIMGLLLTVLDILFMGVAIAVVGGIIYGAVMYASSGGNTEIVKKAKSIIINAFIALVLYAGMWALLNFLVPGGIFQ